MSMWASLLDKAAWIELAAMSLQIQKVIPNSEKKGKYEFLIETYYAYIF